MPLVLERPCVLGSSGPAAASAVPIWGHGRWTGAPPLFEVLVRAWGGCDFHTHRPSGVAPVHNQSLREGARADEKTGVDNSPDYLRDSRVRLRFSANRKPVSRQATNGLDHRFRNRRLRGGGLESVGQRIQQNRLFGICSGLDPVLGRATQK